MLQQNRAKDNFKVLMPIKVTQETPPDLSLKSGFMVKAEGCLKFKSCPKEGLIYTYALIESDSTYAMIPHMPCQVVEHNFVILKSNSISLTLNVSVTQPTD